VASNDPVGIDSLKSTQPGSWVVGDLGICPVGGSLCHQGGPKTTTTSKLNDHGPTPGGAKNCKRCRFFITGPAFLPGLVAHFNATGVKFLEAADRLRARQDDVRKLEDEQMTADREGKQYPRISELDLAYERFTQCTMELDQIAHNAHAAYALVLRCRSLLKKKPAGRGNAKEVSLVLAGDMNDLDVAVRVTTDFELWNAVCQVANIYPNEESTVANLKRARIVDAMLARNGRRPVFATLSEEEALAVGNEYTNFLIARAGYADTLALIEGKKLLTDCGIAKEADELLECRIGAPVELTRIIESPTAPKQIA
jgi:hypothetical protein